MTTVNSYKVNILNILLIILIFFNSVGLPLGLLYTTLFTPFLYLYLWKNKVKYVIGKYFLALLPFIFTWLTEDSLNLFALMQSYTILFSIYISIYSLSFLLSRNDNIINIFRCIIWINFILFLFALMFRFTDFFDLMWSYTIITAYTEPLFRLNLFTYEPSYYATILVPFVTFSLVHLLYDFNIKNLSFFSIVTIPFLFSLSMGVIASLMIAIIISSIIHFKKIMLNKKNLFFFSIITITLLLILLTENSISQRFFNVIKGEDTSGQNRLFESTIVAFQIIKTTNFWVGCGLGQTKFFAPLFFEQFWPGAGIYRLTNAVADTLATFGILGIIIRFSVQLLLFYHTKVYKSYYRLTLFIFIFIYQFTGSYLMNLIEYFIWLLVFHTTLNFNTHGKNTQ